MTIYRSKLRRNPLGTITLTPTSSFTFRLLTRYTARLIFIILYSPLNIISIYINSAN